MINYKLFGRRGFLALAASAFCGTLFGKEKESVDPKFVSLREAHIGTVEIDLRIMNQFQTQPQGGQDFYVACRTAMTNADPERNVAQVLQRFGVKTLGGVSGPGAFGANKEEQLFGYPRRSWAFGEFTFSKADQRLDTVFRLIDETGKELEAITLKT